MLKLQEIKKVHPDGSIWIGEHKGKTLKSNRRIALHTQAMSFHEDIVDVAKISGNWLVGIFALLSNEATPLTAPLSVLGNTEDKSSVPYSNAVPVPLTRTYCDALEARKVGSELSGDVSNH